MPDLATKLANTGTTVSKSEHGWTFRTGAPQDDDYLRVTIQRDQHGAEDSHQLIITTQRTILTVDLSGVELDALESIVGHHADKLLRGKQ